MIRIEKVEVWGFEHAIRGMRNPLNSWDRSDSFFNKLEECRNRNNCNTCVYRKTRCIDNGKSMIGDKDIKLMKRLYKGGSEHRKYARQIFVSMDITAPHHWWFDFDTYKIGVTKNSCSKMHKLHVKEFTYDDFTHEGIDSVDSITKSTFKTYITELERLRQLFNMTNEKKYWRALLEMLPMSFNLKATVTMTYENVFNIINQRTGHKQFEFDILCEALRDLPLVEIIMKGVDGNENQSKGKNEK